MDYKAVAEWALSGTTGLSAEAIATNLCDIGKKTGNYPHDAGDFGRCERLLNAVPELRGRLHEMASVNQYWDALIPVWEAIRSANDADKYALIQAAVRKIEDQDPSIIRLGDGITMRFGRP